MHVHFIQHVAFERPGYIQEWAEWNGFEVSFTHLYEGGVLPDIEKVDLLVVMGGPMGVDDNDTFLWLDKEREFIKACIEGGKFVLGICLGAQLIASVLGARVYASGVQEIGWYPIELTSEGNELWGGFDPDGRWNVLHWHGDTFELPEGACLLASSEAIKHQAFSYGDKVLALQFHLEATPSTLSSMINKLGAELEALQEQEWVMSGKEMVQPEIFFHDSNAMLEAILDRFVGNE